MPLLPAKANMYVFVKSRGTTPEQKKVVKSEFEVGLHFMVPDVYKFQMICLRKTKVIEQKSNV